jgi:catechol-2,3-dioxygenase
VATLVEREIRRCGVPAAGNMAAMPGIAKMRAVALDCPEPRALAEFYRELVGGDITYADHEWVNLRDGDTVLLSFQLAPDHQPPTWPEPDRPQQFHIDVTVEEARLDEAEQKVLALGATKHEVQPGDNWRVYLDPAGHPFCLCWD